MKYTIVNKKRNFVFFNQDERQVKLSKSVYKDEVTIYEQEVEEFKLFISYYKEQVFNLEIHRK